MKKLGKSVLAVTLALVMVVSLTVTVLTAVSAANTINAPTNVRIQNSANGLYVTWNKATNAAKYRVFYKTKESDWSYKDSGTNNINLNNLLYGTLYYIQIQSLGNNNARGNYTKVTSMTHVRTTKLTSAVYNSNGTVTVRWNAADGANGYAVAKKKQTDKKYTYYYTADTSFTDKDVEAGTVYNYQIRPYYTNGKSAAYALWSNSLSVTTLFRPTITNIVPYDNFLNINWNAIKGAKVYQIAFKSSQAKSWSYYTSDARYVNFYSLILGETYYVQVRAVNGNLKSPYSAVRSYVFRGKDPYEGLTYYEAGETVKVTHPAETELVWVVDEAAHDETKTEVKSVYHYRICQGCGAVGDGWTAEEIKNHDWLVHGIEPGTMVNPFPKPKSGYVNEPVDTILHVSEKGHYEVKVIKEAWEEDVTIAQSGWYKTVTHPAETTQAKVIDKAAYYYEEPVYEYVYKHLCWGCDADVGVMDDKETTTHMKEHHEKGEISGYRYVKLKNQVDTKRYDVPEVNHNETVITKQTYNELVFVLDK